MLDVGKQQAKRQKIRNMAFVQGDAEALPFLDNRFDIVISRLAFHHFSNPYRCFSEMARVVKPSGKLVLIDMEAAEYALRDTEDQIEILRDPSHVRNLSKKELESLFTDHGFTLTACDCKKIPVSLSAWLALTNTPEKVSKMIAERMQQELKGGAQTGFYPYFLGNELYFHQRWILLIGKKQSQKPEVFPYPETL